MATISMLAAAASSAASPALPQGALRVQRAEFIDRQGFEKPMVAAFMLIPAAWQQQTAVEWNVRQRCTRPYAMSLRAQAADGSAAIELAPGEGWGQATQGAVGDCPTAPWRNTPQYLAAWVERHRPGARWLDYRARPDKSQPEQRQAFGNGGGVSQRVDSGQTLIAYQTGGREMRETLVANVSFMQSRLVTASGQVFDSMQAQSLGVLAWRAPAGTLDM